MEKESWEKVTEKLTDRQRKMISPPQATPSSEFDDQGNQFYKSILKYVTFSLRMFTKVQDFSSNIVG